MDGRVDVLIDADYVIAQQALARKMKTWLLAAKVGILPQFDVSAQNQVMWPASIRASGHMGNHVL